jgi:hypothetical protein
MLKISSKQASRLDVRSSKPFRSQKRRKKCQLFVMRELMLESMLALTLALMLAFSAASSPRPA